MATLTQRLLDAYPRIFLACHVRHVRDPKTNRVLTGNQVEILDHLAATGAIGLNPLARHMGVRAATMSVSIDRLVGLGYVARVESSTDRRKVELSLTGQGRRIVEEHSVLDPERIDGLLEELSQQEREEALAGLERLAGAADRLLAKIGAGWGYLEGSEK